MKDIFLKTDFTASEECSLDPWSENTKRVFEAHLEKLSESRVYQALIDQHTAVQLTTRFGELTLKDK